MTEKKKNRQGASNHEAENVSEIEAEIEETRGAISEDLRAIGEKLSAENMKAEAKEALREAKDAAREKLREKKDAAIGKAHEVTDAAVQTVSETLDEVGESARRTGDAALSFVRENAVPLTLIGIGAAWLVSKSRRPNGDGWTPPRHPRGMLRERGQRVSAQVREGAHEMSSKAGRAAHDVAERAERGVKDRAIQVRHAFEHEYGRARDGSREMLETNPLLIGAAAVVAGIGVGLALPASDKEQRMLGPTRDRLLGQAKRVTSDAKQLAKDVVSDAKQVAGELVSG